jgi:hypothetical protein
MAPKIHKTADPVLLDGFQAILKPSEFGYTLTAILTNAELIETLEHEREEIITALKAKLKNPKRAVLKPEPWEEVAEGQYKLKFGWDAKTKPTVVDSEGTLITDERIPIYSGSKVRLAFVQKGYILKDGITYGTSTKLSGIQVISIAANPSVPPLSSEEAKDLFGVYEGGFSADDIPPADVDNDAEEEESTEDIEF